MTQEEIDMLKRAIDTHISLLYRDEDAYAKNGNQEAAKDCLAEIKKYRSLKQKLLEHQTSYEKY